MLLPVPLLLLVLPVVPTLPAAQLPLPPPPAPTIPSMLVPACVTTDVGTLESCTTTSEAVVDKFIPKAAAADIIAAGGCVTSAQWTAEKRKKMYRLGCAM